MLRQWLFSLLTRRVVARRPPDFVIGGTVRPYIRRWWVIPRNRFFNIYLHNILRDDDDRALHDHPWVDLTFVLAGGYFEETPDGRFWRPAGTGRLRLPRARHRLELPLAVDGPYIMNLDGGFQRRPAWTLFVTGPKVRVWGFWCERGFVPWYDFVDPDDPGAVGPGCDQPANDDGRVANDNAADRSAREQDHG